MLNVFCELFHTLQSAVTLMPVENIVIQLNCMSHIQINFY